MEIEYTVRWTLSTEKDCVRGMCMSLEQLPREAILGKKRGSLPFCCQPDLPHVHLVGANRVVCRCGTLWKTVNLTVRDRRLVKVRINFFAKWFLTYLELLL